jgi:hypothetical protein
LNQFNWAAMAHCRTFYVRRQETNTGSGPRQKTVHMHAAIMTPPEGWQVDHVDGNGLNNQRSNLRVVTARQNQHNRVHKQAGCSSRFRGVSLHKRSGKWKAQIKLAGVIHYLGMFSCEVAAAAAYDVAGFARDPEHFTPNFSASFLAPR